MSRSVALITVMHTGTLSVRKSFEDAGYRRNKPKYAFGDIFSPTWRLYQAHTFATAALQVRKKVPLITTIRDPQRVASSWMSRYGHLEKDHHSLRQQYRDWLRYVLPNAEVVIPIDIPGAREDAMRRVSELVGTKLPPLSVTNKWEGEKVVQTVNWPEIKHSAFDVYRQHRAARA